MPKPDDKNRRLRLAIYLGLVLTLAVVASGGDDSRPSGAINDGASRYVSPAARLTAMATVAEREKALWPLVCRLAEKHGLDPALVMGVVHTESRFDPLAVSDRGAIGLMQITPGTCEVLGLDNPLDPGANLEAGIRYLARLHKRFKGNLRLTLAAYNAGPTKVSEKGQVPMIEETKNFVQRVMAERGRYLDRFGLVGQVAQK